MLAAEYRACLQTELSPLYRNATWKQLTVTIAMSATKRATEAELTLNSPPVSSTDLLELRVVQLNI